jgi:Flp pilus assembly protein TadG
MGICKERKGQTLVETAIVLFLLLLILLGITEFARAWYTKNSLKNAARQGARVAVVADSITPTKITNPPPGVGTYVPCGNSCPPASTPADNSYVIGSVCCSPGIKNDATITSVSLTYMDDDGSTDLSPGDTILVSVKSTFTFIVGNSPWPWNKTQTFTTDASMRYE